MYRVHCVKVQKEDEDKADKIIRKHWLSGEMDSIRVSEHINNDGSVTVNYWISPFVYDDLLSIIDELKQDGIQVT